MRTAQGEGEPTIGALQPGQLAPTHEWLGQPLAAPPPVGGAVSGRLLETSGAVAAPVSTSFSAIETSPLMTGGRAGGWTTGRYLVAAGAVATTLFVATDIQHELRPNTQYNQWVDRQGAWQRYENVKHKIGSFFWDDRSKTKSANPKNGGCAIDAPPGASLTDNQAQLCATVQNLQPSTSQPGKWQADVVLNAFNANDDPGTGTPMDPIPVIKSFIQGGLCSSALDQIQNEALKRRGGLTEGAPPTGSTTTTPNPYKEAMEEGAAIVTRYWTYVEGKLELIDGQLMSTCKSGAKSGGPPTTGPPGTIAPQPQPVPTTVPTPTPTTDRIPLT